MKSVINKQIIWWRDVPIDVELGLLDYLSKNWKGKIIVICANTFERDRTSCLWDYRENNNVEFMVGDLDNKFNSHEINNLINSDSIHLFSGIRGGHQKYLNKLRKKKIHNCILFMESPSLYGKKIKKTIKQILYPLLYGYYNLKYGKMFKALFVMGHDAKNIYSRYGWNKNKIFEFIYLPKTNLPLKPNSNKNDLSMVKGLYIGRFDFETKGLNILMKSIDLIHPKNDWEIDFVGGYGKNKDEVIEWCLKNENVNFLGTWSYDCVVNNMAHYDFCIVPSLYDGWNMAPLQSINAAIGCIVSNNAGSNSLIKNSKSGEVFQAGNSIELKKILENAIDNIELRESWKSNAAKFQKFICNDAVGKYFIDVLLYVFEEERNMPTCPWEKIV